MKRFLIKHEFKEIKEDSWDGRRTRYPTSTTAYTTSLKRALEYVPKDQRVTRIFKEINLKEPRVKKLLKQKGLIKQ